MEVEEEVEVEVEDEGVEEETGKEEMPPLEAQAVKVKKE